MPDSALHSISRDGIIQSLCGVAIHVPTHLNCINLSFNIFSTVSSFEWNEDRSEFGSLQVPGSLSLWARYRTFTSHPFIIICCGYDLAA